MEGILAAFSQLQQAQKSHFVRTDVGTYENGERRSSTAFDLTALPER